MEQSSSSSFFRLVTLWIFTNTFFSSFKPIESVYVSQDLNTQISRNPPVSSPQPPPSPPSSSYSTPIAQPPPLPTHPPSTIPALFVIGDSSVDSGTNNFLGTLARADHLPYGRDFDTHQPTGRFSNGRIPVDYLASYLGLPLVPSYLGQSEAVEDMIHGLNFASADAEIIFSSGAELGQNISFSQQIQQVMDTFQQFIMRMGEKAATEHISNSMFYISIGTNDFIHYYLRDVSGVQSKYDSWRFNQFLAKSMRQEIKNLYNAKVRRVVVMGLAPIGCAPYYLWQYHSNNGECIEKINDMIMEFNFNMRYTVEELNKELTDANIVFCDAYGGSMDILKNADHFGFSVTNTACCGLGRHNNWQMCLSAGMACRNASNHLWWDQFHPTAAVNEILAENVWSGLHTSMCYPMNMKDMITQRVELYDQSLAPDLHRRGLVEETKKDATWLSIIKFIYSKFVMIVCAVVLSLIESWCVAHGYDQNVEPLQVTPGSNPKTESAPKRLNPHLNSQLNPQLNPDRDLFMATMIMFSLFS